MRCVHFIIGLFVFLFQTTSFGIETIYLDASGRDGKDGAPGASYSTSPGASFTNGSDGGDAGTSSPGTGGSTIDVKLEQIETSTQKAVLVISGKVKSSSVSQKLDLNTSTLVTADSHGGAGGDGGVGGDGEGGGHGTDGINATKYSYGTNGTSGYQGGNGGNGTPGSDGGNGGQVQAKVKIDQTHLFLAFTCNVKAGEGGNWGRNGQGGSGGYGGRGGSSYYSSESVYDGQDCRTVSSSNGNGSYSTSQVCSSRYRTVTYSNPGGISGSDGVTGSSGNGNVEAGKSGTDGNCTYVVESPDGSLKEYKNKFTLSILSFTIRDENRDGIIEPGEKVFIENIVVRNDDGVPSPSGKSTLSLFLNSTYYALAEPISLVLPQISSNSTYKVPDKLELNIKDTNPVGIDEPWKDHDNISVNNHVTVVDRSIPGFEKSRIIEISYPIQLTRFDFPKSAAAGEIRPVVWAIKNVSGKDFGGESELSRILKIHFEKIGGLARSDTFTFKDNQDKKVVIDTPYIKEILKLKAGEEIRIEGTLAIPENSLPYTDLDVATNLDLSMRSSSDPRTIQVNRRNLRIAQTFNPSVNADILLVTSNKTSREEFVAWQNIFKNLHLSSAVWDLSYYGYLSLSKDFENSNSNLKSYLRNKSMIILNDSSLDNLKENLSRDEFLDAAAHSNVRFLILGGHPKELNSLVQQLIMPNESQFSKDWNFNEDLKKEDLPSDVGEALTMNLIKTYYFWDSPKKEELKKQSFRWNQFVKNIFPDQKYVFSYYFSTGLKNRNWYSKTYDIGKIRIGRSLTPGGGMALSLSLTDQELHNAVQIESEETYRAVILSLNPETVLRIAPEFNLQKSKIGYWVQDALIYQAISEIDREQVFYDVKGNPPEKNRWPFMKKFIQYIEKNKSDQTALLIGNIGAAIDFYYKVILFFGNYSLLNQISKWRNEMEKYAKEINFSLYNDNRNVFLKKLERNLQTRKKLLVDLDDRENVRHQLTWPAIHRLNTSEIILQNNIINDEN